MAADGDALLDFNEEEEDAGGAGEQKAAGAGDGDGGDGAEGAEGGAKRGHYAGIHASGFRDFMLKSELQRAVVECGFEHPSEVQHKCIPDAVLGTDIICQAKSGMGKTAVFVLATLHQINASEETAAADGEGAAAAQESAGPAVLVLCHTRELAYQIAREYERFSKFLPAVRCQVVFGGVPMRQDIEAMKTSPPHIVVGTPGRTLALARNGALKMGNISHFVLDECDKMLEALDMRRDVQDIFRMTPHDKQVMMFSATLDEAVRPVCRRFCQTPSELFIDDDSKLTLHGLQQFYLRLEEGEKNRKLNDLLDALDFNQVVIFVSKVRRAVELDRLLNDCNFPSICIHAGIKKQEERIERYRQFKEFNKRILVSTDLFGRGIDIERVNIVINYDFPDDTDQYLHRVGRAGRFGTKGLAISFVSSEDDESQLQSVQQRFEVNIPELPDEIDVSSYM